MKNMNKIIDYILAIFELTLFIFFGILIFIIIIILFFGIPLLVLNYFF